MSQIASPAQVRPANCQLPMSWYFDPEVFAREKKLLFDAGSNYVGHELMVPEVGNYQTLAWMDHAKVLVRNQDGVELHSSPLTRWHGLLFAGPRDPRKDLADFGCGEDFDFSGYVLDRVETTDYATNWKTFVEAQKAAYDETAQEDDEICRRLDRGRRALWREDRDDAGPYQSPMEDTMVHFHEWLRRGLERT